MSPSSPIASQDFSEDTALPTAAVPSMAQASLLSGAGRPKQPFRDLPTLADEQLDQDQLLWDNASAQMWPSLDPWATQMVNESVEARIEKAKSNATSAALEHGFNKATGFPDWVDLENPSHWMFWAWEESEALAPANGLFTKNSIKGGFADGRHTEPLMIMGSAGTPSDLPRGPALAAAVLASGIMSVELSRLHQGLGVGARAWAIWTLLETTDFLDAMQAEGSFQPQGVLSSPRALAAREALTVWAKARAESAAVRDARAMASLEEQNQADGVRAELTMQEAVDWALAREEIRKGMDNLRVNQLFNWKRGEQLWRKAVVRVERDELDEAVASARQAVLGVDGEPEGLGGAASGEETGKRGGRRL